MQPQILVLNKSGQPFMWTDVETAIVYRAKNLIKWELGQEQYTLNGGINRISGNRSSLSTSSIIAVDGKYSPSRVTYPSRELVFQRDLKLCAYCGQKYTEANLTLDHIIPKYHKGENSWTNLITACKSCNHRKAARTPEQASMKLLYVPYEPNINEAFILQNRRILADQMEFLVNSGLSKHSRITL